MTRKVTIINPLDAGCPITRIKPQRNAPCTCGSGKKQKRCCGTKTRYFSPRKVIPTLQNPNPKEQPNP